MSAATIHTNESAFHNSAFVVNGPTELNGTVTVAGAKNSVLKLMAATLLAEGLYRISNVPQITDVEIMAELLTELGCSVATHADRSGSLLEISVPAQINTSAPRGIADRLRASTAVMGPLLARNGEALVALPGGDDFGDRPIDMHVRGLAQLGAEVEILDGCVRARAARLDGANVRLDFPSVGATENLLMAAVLAVGTTVIDNAAREPEIVDLCEFLQKMGACLEGAGSSTIWVEGVSRETLSAADHTVVGDRIVAASFLTAVGITSGAVVVEGVQPTHLEMYCHKLTSMGMDICKGDESISARASQRLCAAKFATLPYPGVATDLKPFLVALLATADGLGSVTENLFAKRFRYIDELRLMGAKIRIDSHHVLVEGVERLRGAVVTAHDIRAGAALVVAGLAADGESIVRGAHHIARGYDDFAGQLQSLGADVVVSSC